VGACLRRAREAGSAWPLAEEMTKEALEVRLYPASAAVASNICHLILPIGAISTQETESLATLNNQGALKSGKMLHRTRRYHRRLLLGHTRTRLSASARVFNRYCLTPNFGHPTGD